MTQLEFDALFEFLRKQFNTPVQCREEFRRLIELVSTLQPRNILEIGVERGGTLPFWQQIVPEDGLIVGVDTQVSKVLVELGSKPPVKLLEGDSHDLEVILKVMFSMPEIDFLFLDGDHSYEGVKADFDNFRPLVRPGGIVAFHDICDEGVARFWNEVKDRCFRTDKFHEQSGGIGIGIVYL